MGEFSEHKDIIEIRWFKPTNPIPFYRNIYICNVLERKIDKLLKPDFANSLNWQGKWPYINNKGLRYVQPTIFPQIKPHLEGLWCSSHDNQGVLETSPIFHQTYNLNLSSARNLIWSHVRKYTIVQWIQILWKFINSYLELFFSKMLFQALQHYRLI